ncbi:MAG: SMP-30/gluconolactonase/LRE family protein [Candidatus Latescibacteria bacterium]|nr:SMP-30/gluconolactonase/LRE family protein [Candidatus Latescibacterota bacterium]
MSISAVTALLLVATAGFTETDESATDGDSGTHRVWDMVPQDTFTGLVEGPVCDAEGTLFAMGYGELTDGSSASGQFVALLTMLGLWEGSFALGRVSADGTHGTFVDVPAGGMANGLRFDQQGQLFVADVTGHNVLRLDPISKAISVFAHEPRMNQPNDLAITDADVLFASDPNWSEGTGQLWRIDPDGTVHLMETEMGTTNGIEVGPDGGTLYVGESAQRWIWQYDLSADGQLSNKRLLITFEDFGLDGMRCDEMGNLYVTRYGKGTVAIISPGGELLDEITIKGKTPTNIAFGGTDGRTCYVTVSDRGCIEAFRAPHAGRSWAMMHTDRDRDNR